MGVGELNTQVRMDMFRYRIGTFNLYRYSVPCYPSSSRTYFTTWILADKAITSELDVHLIPTFIDDAEGDKSSRVVQGDFW